MSHIRTPEDHVIVVFGANGDLARRKLLPALYHLAAEGLMPERYAIIGNSRSEMDAEGFRAFARDAVDDFCRCSRSEELWDDFARRLSYVSCEFQPGNTDAIDDAVRKAEAELGAEARRLFYLAVPPPAFSPITQGIGAAGLTERARVVYEKPYGTDVDSFRALDRLVHDVLDESQVYRIDHYLGKETVQNILALRFANGMFEPVWNRNFIDHVQIDVPEMLGVGTRAGFYERTGALKDMVVTHLLQVLSFIAMEPPRSLDADALIDEKVRVMKAMVPLGTEDVVRGQYDGYLETEGVAPGSDTETFVAARLFIENARWSGVPFYLRTGKQMAESRSSVILAFRPPRNELFERLPSDAFERDHLTLELGHEEGISVSFLAKVPGPTIELGPAHMTFRYEGSFGSELIEAYERLIHDAPIGDRTLFTRGDGIERTWQVVGEVIAKPSPLKRYAPGSWGPKEAHELIAPRRWHFPAGHEHK
jgi:glucose-6-phosphate 1-dehydrogenase